MNTQGSLVVAALAVAFTFFISGCGDGAWNNPHPADEAGKNILYSNFSGPPKHLDPVISLLSNLLIVLFILIFIEKVQNN